MLLRKVGRQYMIIDASNGNANVTDVFTMNESAANIWQYINGREFTPAELEKWVCDTYKIAPRTAHRDVDNLLRTWKELGLIQ